MQPQYEYNDMKKDSGTTRNLKRMHHNPAPPTPMAMAGYTIVATQDMQAMLYALHRFTQSHQQQFQQPVIQRIDPVQLRHCYKCKIGVTKAKNKLCHNCASQRSKCCFRGCNNFCGDQFPACFACNVVCTNCNFRVSYQNLNCDNCKTIISQWESDAEKQTQEEESNVDG